MTDRKKIIDEFAQEIYCKMMDLFFNPEISKRKEQNKITDDFKLLAAQLIIFPFGKGITIRLNNEIAAEIRLKEEIDETKGNLFPIHQEIEYLKLSGKRFANCGHVTILFYENEFRLFCDFAYNKEISVKHLKVAEQFLKTSKFALENQFLQSFIDNSFSALELLAKTNLLLEANPKIQGKTIHKTIHTAFNLRFKDAQKDFEIERRKVLNELSTARNAARYLEGNVFYDQSELSKIYKTIEHMYMDLARKADYNAG